jgi:cellulase (glycosyl hydrolase family 5)
LRGIGRATRCVAALVALGSLAFAASARANVDWLGVNTAQAIRSKAVTPSAFYDRLTGMGGNVLREDVNWNEVEPEDDSWQWAMLDREINSAPPGVGMILVFSNSPRWARDPSENLLACGWKSPVTCRMPPARTKLNEWMEFVRATVSRYQSRVVAVEIWNEPNYKNFWRPRGDEPARWATLVQAGAEATAQVDPAIQVITGGLGPAEEGSDDPYLGMEQGRYLEAAYASNPSLANLVDGIGIHPYPGQFPPDHESPGNRYLGTLREIRAVRDARDPGTPLWVTEIGYYTRGNRAVTEAQQRDWLLRIYDELNAAPDVKAMIVHLFESTWSCGLLICDERQTSYGIVKTLGDLPKPAWTGFHNKLFP